MKIGLYNNHRHFLICGYGLVTSSRQLFYVVTFRAHYDVVIV